MVLICNIDDIRLSLFLFIWSRNSFYSAIVINAVRYVAEPWKSEKKLVLWRWVLICSSQDVFGQNLRIYSELHSTYRHSSKFSFIGQQVGLIRNISTAKVNRTTPQGVSSIELHVLHKFRKQFQWIFRSSLLVVSCSECASNRFSELSYPKFPAYECDTTDDTNHILWANIVAPGSCGKNGNSTVNFYWQGRSG